MLVVGSDFTYASTLSVGKIQDGVTAEMNLLVFFLLRFRAPNRCVPLDRATHINEIIAQSVFETANCRHMFDSKCVASMSTCAEHLTASCCWHGSSHCTVLLGRSSYLASGQAVSNQLPRICRPQVSWVIHSSHVPLKCKAFATELVNHGRDHDLPLRVKMT